MIFPCLMTALVVIHSCTSNRTKSEIPYMEHPFVLHRKEQPWYRSKKYKTNKTPIRWKPPQVDGSHINIRSTQTTYRTAFAIELGWLPRGLLFSFPFYDIQVRSSLHTGAVPSIRHGAICWYTWWINKSFSLCFFFSFSVKIHCPETMMRDRDHRATQSNSQTCHCRLMVPCRSTNRSVVGWVPTFPVRSIAISLCWPSSQDRFIAAFLCWLFSVWCSMEEQNGFSPGYSSV